MTNLVGVVTQELERELVVAGLIIHGEDTR